jgi:SAM-dependent methyltransferase
MSDPGLSSDPFDSWFGSVLRCPAHIAAGALRRNAHRGELSCPKCARPFHTVDHVWDMLGDQDEAESFFLQEQAQWDKQADAYEAERVRDAIYMHGVHAAVRALAPQQGDRVLDAGCGTGLTVRRYFHADLRVAALDLSGRSLAHLRATIGTTESLALVRGNLAALPFADGAFDRVLCANAIQHLPTKKARSDCVRELARVTRPGGRLVVTAHGYSTPKRRAGWVKEGTAKSSSGDIQYIYRFDGPEFRLLLEEACTVRRLGGAGFPLPYKWKLTGLSRRLEAWLSKVPAATPWANMLVGVCTKSDAAGPSGR